MDPQLGPPSPSPSVAPANDPKKTDTTITDLGDDILLDIFLRLPSLPCLVRVALACLAFLRAVRSSPAFRRRFGALHPPQILGFFEDNFGMGIPTFATLRRYRDDIDLAAAVLRSDLRLTRLPRVRGHPMWEIISCRSGYLFLYNHNTRLLAAYNPISRALHIFPGPPRDVNCVLFRLLFHIVFSQDDPRSFRVVCVTRRVRRRRGLARFAVFSSETREWQEFPWVDTSVLQQWGHPEGDKCLLPSYTATPGNEFHRLVLWKHRNQAYIVVLNAATLQFSRMDLPLYLKDVDSTEFHFGTTKDGNLAMVFLDHLPTTNTGDLCVWFWRPDDAADGVEKWMPHTTFPTRTFRDPTMSSQDLAFFSAQPVAVIDGFVYMSNYGNNGRKESQLSFCLETEEVNKLSECKPDINIHPYIMAWPPLLLCNKEDGLADDGPAGTASQG